MFSKVLVHLFLMISMMTSTAMAYSSYSVLPSQDEARVLRWLNNACGDAWCEGVFDLRFTKIEFNTEKNAYFIHVKTIADHSDQITAESKVFQCEINDPSVVLKTLENWRTEESFDAQERFYQSISQCIFKTLYSQTEIGF